MAYRIEYRSGKGVMCRLISGIPSKTSIALILCMLMFLVRTCSAKAAQQLAGILAHGPESVTERAVVAMADAVASGEGWYYGLTVWCRTILFGT